MSEIVKLLLGFLAICLIITFFFPGGGTPET